MNFLLVWFMTQIISCFRFYNEPAGAATNPPPAHPKSPESSTKELTMDDLTSVIKTVVKEEFADGGGGKEAIDALKKEITDVNRKAIFPDSDWGDEVESAGGKSVIDTSFFTKNYQRATPKFGEVPWLPDGQALGSQLVNMGAPFKRLSPEMVTFGRILKEGKGKVDLANQAGIDVRKYNDTCKEHLKQAGMSEGVLADGGALVPIEFLATVIEFATSQSTILSKVWRLPMNSNIMRIPRLVQAAGSYFGGVTLYSPGEGKEKTDTKPELERLELEAKKRIAMIYMTDELIADSMINLINYVTGVITRAYQYDMELNVIAGVGGAAPCTGIINDPAINLVPRQTAGTVTYQDVINLDNSIDENFTNLSWITRKVTQNTLLGLVDNNNRPIFMADYGVFTGEPFHPPTMITYPVHRTRNIPTMGMKGDLILGDLSWYLLAIRQELTIDSSIHVRFIYDETALRFVMRYDGMPAVSIAFSILDDVET